MTIPNKPLKVLLDHGIITHAGFAKGAVQNQESDWGQTLEIHGLIRKAPNKNKAYQNDIDALFTIGRLIREEKISAYDYIEISFEGWRDTEKIHEFNALQGCNIDRCKSAIERSKFRSSVNLRDTISKGGKKDRQAKIPQGITNQIAFFDWLAKLDPSHVDLIIQSAPKIGLTDFEIDSLKRIAWFEFLCKRSGSTENYPDVFHLWTAERNSMDVFLTLEKKLTKLVSRVKNENRSTIEIQTEVLRPLDLLRKLGIENPDPVPMQHNRFYHLHEAEGEMLR